MKKESALTKAERREWIELNDRDAEAQCGRGIFTSTDRKRLNELTRRMRCSH